uniref:NADH-ubiquinone oxidoreductase chain 4L n=1 Tax=Echinolaelaps echidninus TaxID=2759148 RepID=A0AB74RXN8_9ACAR
MISISLLMFFIGLLSFIFNKKHILAMLLSMEIMVVGLFLIMLSCSFINSLIEFTMIFLIMIVCESCLGLSLLILIMNFYGNDLICSANLLN